MFLNEPNIAIQIPSLKSGGCCQSMDPYMCVKIRPLSEDYMPTVFKVN